MNNAIRLERKVEKIKLDRAFCGLGKVIILKLITAKDWYCSTIEEMV